MKRLILAAVLALCAGTAQAQNTAPAVEFFLGPSIGKQWATPDAWTGLSFNAQTGTTYTIAATDWGKTLTFANGSAIAVTLPVATAANFKAGACFVIIATGAGTATVTPTTSTINGQATQAYATGVGGRICNTGTAYLAY